MEFHVGETVRLKSGGTNMTVEKIPARGRGNIRCQWHDGTKWKSRVFAPQLLEIAPESMHTNSVSAKFSGRG